MTANESNPGVPEGAPVVSWHLPRMIIAWAVAAVIGVLVTLFAGSARAEWLVVAVGIATLVSFALQIGTAQREGFISRLAFSISGSVLIIAVIDIVGIAIETLDLLH